MSPDLERRLRDARDTLLGPDASTTRSARERAIGALQSPRRRIPSRFAVGLALMAALVLGVGLGATVAPSGSAAEGPTGVGFVPQDGWFVTQNGADATPGQPALAIASNVPLRPGDGDSLVPYDTLRALPPGGVVLVAHVIRDEYESVAETSLPFPPRELPLLVEDAAPFAFSAQIRPGRALGQRQLRGIVNGHGVDLHLYFGVPEPSEEVLAEAQRQLDQLVVAPRPESVS